MKFPVLFVLATLLFDTATAGYRHIYENLFTFYAYRLELNLPKGQRIIGVKCVSADFTTKECMDGSPKYKHCQGTVSVTIRGTTIPDTCSLREFLSHISGNKNYRSEPFNGEEFFNYRDKEILGRRVGENSLDFDMDYAAKQMAGTNRGNFQAPPYAKVKNGEDKYLASCRSIARRIGYLRTNLSPADLEQNKNLFDAVQKASKNVALYRRVDYDKFLLPKLRTLETKALFEIETMLNGEEVLRYDETVAKLKKPAAGISQSSLQQRVAAFNNVIKRHDATDEAQKHRVPITQWQNLASLMGDVPGCNPKD